MASLLDSVIFLAGEGRLSGKSNPVIMQLNMHVLFYEPWQLEGCGDSFSVWRFVYVHSKCKSRVIKEVEHGNVVDLAYFGFSLKDREW